MAGFLRAVKNIFKRRSSKEADGKREDKKEGEKKVDQPGDSLHQCQAIRVNGRLGERSQPIRIHKRRMCQIDRFDAMAYGEREDREDDIIVVAPVDEEWPEETCMMFGDQYFSLEDRYAAEGIEEAEEMEEMEEIEEAEEMEETQPNFIIIEPEEMEETEPESFGGNNADSWYGSSRTEETEPKQPEETEFATLFREYISACLEQGECKLLFREVLKTRDSERLMILCEEAIPSHVLDLTSPVLTQPLIFSLIHHLSLNLADNTTLRLKYLDDALMALDTTSELYEQDGRPLLLNLCHNLRDFLRDHPEHSENTEFLRNTCTELMKRG